MTPSASLIVTSLCLSALAAAVAGAQEAPSAGRDTDRSLMEGWLADARHQERWYHDHLVGQLKTEDGNGWTEEAVFSTLRENRAGLETAIGRVNAAHEALAAREITLAQFQDRVRAAMEWAAVHATAIAIDRASWEVRRLQWRNIERSRTLAQEFRAEEDAIPDAGYAEAVRALRSRYRDLERAGLRETIEEYTAATRAFCARRGTLCTDLWRLVAVAQGNGRPADARELEKRLRDCWETPRAGQGDSMVDHFCDFPGSADRLILRRNWVDDIPTLHRMNSALAAEPVENFRPGGSGRERPEFRGTQMEQVARTLSQRLLESCELEARQEAGWQRLARLNLEARRTAGATPDVAAVAAALESYLAAVHEGTSREESRRRATGELQAAIDAVSAAENALARAQGSVFLTRALRVVAAGAGGGHRASELISARRRQIEAHERLLRDEGLPEHQRTSLEEVSIPRLRGEIATIEEAVARASEREATARAQAVAARDAARMRLNALPTQDLSRQADLWSDFRSLYAATVEALPETERRGLREPAPDNPEQAARAAGRNVNLLRERAAALGTARDDVRRDLQETLAALRRDEVALRELGLRIVNLRISALVTAEAALESLGATSRDHATVAIGRLKDQLQKGLGVFARVDDCTRALDEVLRHDPLEVRKKIVGVLQERMGIAGDTLGILGTAAESAEAIRALSNDLLNERTALRAVSTLLDFSANAGEAVPVLGAVLAPMMKIYGMSAATACDAAIAVQDRIIEQNIRNLFDRPRPERHLYTLREVAASCSLFSEDAHRRITTMLQVRRLIALAGAETASEARDGR